MEKQNFRNDAAECGANIGAIAGRFDGLGERWMTLSGSMRYCALITVEWIGVVVLHCSPAAPLRAQPFRNSIWAEEGFSFGQGYLFVLAVSAFAGVIVGGVQYIYLHLIMGYSNYTSRLVEALHRHDGVGRRRAGVDGVGDGPVAGAESDRACPLGACDRLGRYLGKPALRRCFRPYHCRCAFARSAAVRYAGR